MLAGNAVLFVSYDTNSMRFLNSDGTEFGDKGFFKVENTKVFKYIKFLDVYWEVSDLTNEEN
jgi:hypothetical protein